MTPQDFIQRMRVVHELRPAYVQALFENGIWICIATGVTKFGRCVFVVSPNVANGQEEIVPCASAEDASQTLILFREVVAEEGWHRIPVGPEPGRGAYHA